MDDIRLGLRPLVAAASRHRRLLAAGLAAAAVALGIEAASPTAPETVDVTVAASDLDGGAKLAADDLATARLPPDALPRGLLDADDALGRVLAGPVRAGEPITDRRLLGPAVLDGWGADLVAAPVRLTDPGAAVYLRPGDRINLLATPADGAGPATTVAADTPVLAVEASDDESLDGGALLMVAASPEAAAELAAAAVTAHLSFTMGGLVR